MRLQGCKIILIGISFQMLGCINLLEYVFKDNSASITITTDRPSGRYDAIPATVTLTFPSTVDMTSIASTDFSISDTCAGGTATISSAVVTGQTVAVSFGSIGACANSEAVTLTLDQTKIKMSDAAKHLSGTVTYSFTVDTSAPTVTAAINTVSGISASASYAFSSAPTSVVYTFSSDVDMTSLTASDFTVTTAGATDCSTMPTVGSISKGTGTVTVRLTGASCADGESFLIDLASYSFGDSTRDSTTGTSLPNDWAGPDLDLTITVLTSGASVTDVGLASTSADGTYGIGDPISIDVTFDQTVDVTGTPRLQLNITGGATRYATYSAGTGTTDITFTYTVAVNDTAADLDYSSTAALQLNGGTISRTGSSGGIAATRTLPAPGAPNSLGSNRDIVVDTDVPTITTASPSGTTNTWGVEARTVTFTFSKEIDPSSLADSDLAITAGTCSGSPPSVVSSSVGGAGNTVVSFDLSSHTCLDGETYTLSMDPTLVDDLSANSGYGSARNIVVTTETNVPTVALGAPSKSFVNAAASLTYTVTYSGATSVTLADVDVNFAGASTGCGAVVSGSGTTTRTITITGCSDDGSVQIDLAAGTAVNVYGNLAAAVPEAAITDFTADNLELPDPSLALPVIGLNSVYDEDSVANFTLTFAGDDLGTSGAIQSALALNCDSGGGANPVTLTASRTSATVATVTPNEASSDFVYNADCTMGGTNVPDSAGNLHTFAGLPFKVGKQLNSVSGPSGSLSVSTLTSAGDLGSVVFNVATDPATVTTANVTLDCNGNNIDISNLNLTAGDTDVLIDFDETDPDWTVLVGGESCALTFGTSVTNSLGMPLTAPEVFNFTLTP